MPMRCIIAGCSNTYKDGVSFHRFPKDESIKKIWIKKVRLTRAKWTGPSPSSSLCSEHFTDSDYEDSGSHYSQFGMKKKKMLKSTAIPNVSLKPPLILQPPPRAVWMKRERKRVGGSYIYFLMWASMENTVGLSVGHVGHLTEH